MPPSTYIRPTDGEWSAEIEVKRSTFIGIARQTPTEESARAFINDVRSRYPDARHHCSAYIVHQEAANPIERSSDDGEPSGTAGQPMLEVVRGIMDITVVVVRYFGGVLLGTGGLVRAYQDATRSVLDEVDLVRRQPAELFQITVEHADAGRVESDIRNAGFQVMQVEYGAEAEITVAGDIRELIARITSGQVEAHEAGHTWVDQPVN